MRPPIVPAAKAFPPDRMAAVDPFAQLGFTPRPWLEPGTVETALREQSARWHPDINRDPDAARRFAEIREAGQLLIDPEKRIRWLLENNGRPVSKPQPNPATATLFQQLGQTLTEARELLRSSNPASAIERAVHQQKRTKTARQLQTTLQPLQDRLAELERELQRLDQQWESNPARVLDTLALLHSEWLFLGRWLGTAQEALFELQQHS